MEMEKFIRIAIEFKLIYEYLYLGYYYNYWNSVILKPDTTKSQC